MATGRLDYVRDPATIYRQSFTAIAEACDLSGLDDGMRAVVTRMVHACGLPEIAGRVAAAGDPVGAGIAALRAGAPVLCDARMVAAGVIAGNLAAGNDVVALIGLDGTAARAAAIGNTRSAAAIELARDRLGGAIVVIGNAPTALFHLLELLDDGWPRPAVILGLPVGFVGAAESKAELMANPRGVPALTLHGRAGGSAIAAAALNAIAILARQP